MGRIKTLSGPQLDIPGLEESETNAWETKAQTNNIFHDFLTKGLQMDPTSMNIIDIHRLPQRPIFVNKAKKQSSHNYKIINCNGKKTYIFIAKTPKKIQ